MEYREKIKIAVAIVSLATLSVILTAQYRRRRRQNRPWTSCYLHSDPKPQLSFKRVLADNSSSPFKHLKLNGDSDNETSSDSHPYEKEIKDLVENPRFEFDDDLDMDMDLKMSDSYVWIETESQLKELVDVLSRERIFAVDTEQHSLRSFRGFTALVQISTRTDDYLLDTIALHDEMRILGPLFADPNICKVFHGADNDVLWLQRDFHIYVVNLFDTAKACEVLAKPQKSLAYLLETYCSVATNKLFQREDWRQRPLSAEMLEYARTDAHYLLYIAGCLIVELKQQDSDNSSYPNDKFHFILEASRRSNMICLQLYTKESEVSPGGSAASSILSRLLSGERGSSISSETQDLVRRLCTWRDLMARVHDESLRYVLSDQAIASLAVTIPSTPTEINDTVAQTDSNLDTLSLSSSLPSPSLVVCSHFDDLVNLIQDRKDNLDDIVPMLLKKCLGSNGSCPVSVYNYGLLVNYEMKLTNMLLSKQNGLKNRKQVDRKASRQLFVQKFSCKAPVYHNCRIYANDGRLLCYCDRRKLEWYLQRDLAKLVDENPPAIMLLFEPKGRPEDEDNDFYIQSKKNICVGCGEGSHYLRYRIIPSCYRMHFPEHLKSHRSHDIVLLCVDCHEIAHAAAEKYKRQIAAEFGIPLFVRKVADNRKASDVQVQSSSMTDVEEQGVSPLHLRTAAMALLRHGPRMPSKRREELIQIVRQYYGGREISDEDLERALLVGMSPHERKRFEKKNGFSLKHTTGNILLDKQQASTAATAVKSSIDNELTFSGVDASETTEAEPAVFLEDQDDCTVTDAETSCFGFDEGVDREVSATTYQDRKSDGNEASDAEDGRASMVDDDNCKQSPSAKKTDLNCLRQDGSNPSKCNSKLSLLGHGPHGKQVVDHILKEYGEDGVNQFCQRWRQVFVEALHPRFLPAGWDVMHR
ncbi:hypothetical protein Tsubulata_022285 [Turnera subulata]|uniref:HRDC domain-containing protein n=1 Tax=Turnera subulata TaxID=218843 RepID=A0A9Q0GK15_9ROSI|nr:hypothetical protein Tsubulata_022285 [Turnera subulata]